MQHFEGASSRPILWQDPRPRAALHGPLERSGVADRVRERWRNGRGGAIVYSTGGLVERGPMGIFDIYRMSCGHDASASFGQKGTVHVCGHDSHPMGDPTGPVTVIELEEADGVAP